MPNVRRVVANEKERMSGCGAKQGCRSEDGREGNRWKR